MAAAIVGIIAAMAVPRMSGFARSARIASVQETVRRAQLVLDEQQAITGFYPATIKGEWFPHRRMTNALLPDQSVDFEAVAGSETITDPPIKVAAGLGVPALWYNSGSGSFRARVPQQASAAMSGRLYLKVNLLPPRTAPETVIEAIVVE